MKKIYGRGIRHRPRIDGKQDTPHNREIYLEQLLPLEDYNKIIVLFSGGKDSLACVLHLLELGVPKDKIELWHHDIDGGEPNLHMDWLPTQNYCRAVAEYLGIPLRVSWRIGGFWSEVYRIGASNPILYENGAEIAICKLSERQKRTLELKSKIMGADENAELESYGKRGKFPAKSANLAQRWCSAYLKIMVGESVIRNLETKELEEIGKCNKFPAKSGIANGRYCSPNLKRIVGESVIREIESIGSRMKFPAKGSCHSGRWCSGSLKASVQNGVTSNLEQTKQDVKLLVVSGERREESKGRSKYNEIELHPTNATAKAKRLVHAWRAVIDWTEADIWDIIKRWHITPHPCYFAGWNRCSCAMCIFGLPRHWAGIRELFPDWYNQFRQAEIELGFTLDNKKNLDEYIGNAESCVCRDNPKAIQQLISGNFTVDDVYAENWQYPAGAFKGTEGGPC